MCMYITWKSLGLKACSYICLPLLGEIEITSTGCGLGIALFGSKIGGMGLESVSGCFRWRCWTQSLRGRYKAGSKHWNSNLLHGTYVPVFETGKAMERT